MKTEPGLQCRSVTNNPVSFHEHAYEKGSITVEMNGHTHTAQPWDQHPGEASVPGPPHAPSGHCSLQEATILTSLNLFRH